MKQPLLLRFLFWVVFVAAVQPGWAQTTCEPTAGLVARFPFDEGQGTAPQDVTGQVGAGTLKGGTWQPGGGHDGGGALALTSSDHLSIPLNWQPTAFSFSFWVEPTRLFNWSQGTGAGWGSFLFHSTYDGGIYVGTDVPTRIHISNSNVVELGVWQHFVFAFDNGVGTLYKNGIQIASQGSMTLPAAWQSIGLNGDALYDELRVYNRAVSSQEAQDLYNCAPLFCPPVRIQVSANVSLVAGQAATLQANGAQAANALRFDGVDDLVQVTDATAAAGSPSLARRSKYFHGRSMGTANGYPPN